MSGEGREVEVGVGRSREEAVMAGEGGGARVMEESGENGARAEVVSRVVPVKEPPVFF